MKKFNTTAVSIPSKHYMVDISDKVEQIKELVDDGKYFTINRARQYGKTTTINALENVLKEDYTILDLSFEGLSKDNFISETSFVRAFSRLFKKDPILYNDIPDIIRGQLDDFISRKDNMAEIDELFIALGEWCALSEKPLVMFIDEVDNATNNQVFLDFLAQLRDRYIARERKGIPAFKSVILAGVTDVKHLKLKIRPEDEKKENSPWNIATDFDIDMSLFEAGIKGMLDEYEEDHHTGMDTEAIAKSIHQYTGGYPFLVSRICQLIDENVSKKMSLTSAWTRDGIDEALKLLLGENNTLFQSLTKNPNNYPDLKCAIRSILMEWSFFCFILNLSLTASGTTI